MEPLLCNPFLCQTFIPVQAASSSVSPYGFPLCWLSGPCLCGALHASGSFCLLLHRTLCSDWRFGGSIHLRTECSKVSHLIWLWVSAFLPICYRRKLLSWWLQGTDLWIRGSLYHDGGRAPVYEYTRMSFQVILLLISFFRRVVFVFSLEPWALHSSRTVRYEFHLM